MKRQTITAKLPTSIKRITILKPKSGAAPGEARSSIRISIQSLATAETLQHEIKSGIHKDAQPRP